MALVQQGGVPRSEPLIVTPAAELNGEVSADGQWLAYESNESGQNDIYVRPFPKVEGGRWQISTAGGTRPMWSRNGRELFFLDASGALFAAEIQTSGAFSTGNPRKILDGRFFTDAGGRTYDVSRDGQRFLMVKEPQPSELTSTSPRIVVVVNWFEELKARAAQ